MGSHLRYLSLFSILVMLAMLPATSVRGQDHGVPITVEDTPFRPGALLVKFRVGVVESERARAFSAVGEERHRIRGTGVSRIGVPAGQELEKLELLRANPLVEYAEPDYVALADWMPNDPQSTSQWGLQKIGAQRAWDATKGDRVTVAVIDTGIDLSHPDLLANIVAGWNYVAGTSNPRDDNGHGTHVSGIVAAVGNNGTGGIGVAPNAKIMPLKTLDASGSGYYSDIELAIIDANDRGAKVINMSLGGRYDSQSLHDAVDYAWNRGVVVIAAAGNANSTSPSYPAAYSNAMAIAATDSNDIRASFSNYGSVISVAAPGVSIFSALPLPTGYGFASGTSMAAPFVSGLAALILADANCSRITNSGVRLAIEGGAHDIDGLNPNYAGKLGHGRVDAWRALPAPESISVSSDRASYLNQIGGAPQTRPIGVSTGLCAAAWEATVVQASSGLNWLTVTPSGVGSGTLTISADPAELSAGTYTGSVVVGPSDGNVNMRSTIAVNLVIAPQIYQRSLTPFLKQSN